MDDIEEPLTPSHLLTGHPILSLPDHLCRPTEDDIEYQRKERSDTQALGQIPMYCQYLCSSPYLDSALFKNMMNSAFQLWKGQKMSPILLSGTLMSWTNFGHAGEGISPGAQGDASTPAWSSLSFTCNS